MPPGRDRCIQSIDDLRSLQNRPDDWTTQAWECCRPKGECLALVQAVRTHRLMPSLDYSPGLHFQAAKPVDALIAFNVALSNSALRSRNPALLWDGSSERG